MKILFERSIATYRTHFRLFWKMALIGELPAYVGTVIFLSAMGRPYALGMEPISIFSGAGWKVIGGALALIGLMLSAMFLVAVVYAVEDLDEGKTLTVMAAYRSVPMGMAVAVLLAFILVMLVISIGMMAFIVPGILLAVWFYLSPYAIVIDEAEGWDAFRRSKQLVRGHGGKVLGIIGASFGIELAGSLLIAGLRPLFGSLGSGVLLTGWDLVITPFQILLMIFLYDELRNAESGNR
ncbi:MAG: hypothetical protein DRP97_05810 [Candidatus Latescibacterota bacterium]|nr:MAG: hypothetical protein DRP97_05810 [Candidatus Latescibacterota bacterium]